MENKTTYCHICQKEMKEHEPKFLIPNDGIDIPSSHFIGCLECSKKSEAKASK